MNFNNTFGFWQEFYTKHYQRPSLKEDIKFCQLLDKKDTIVSYMKNANILIRTRGSSTCPIDNTNIGTKEIYSDGKWFWTSEAIYYVEKYNISIPQLFLEHIASKDFVCNKIADIAENDALFEVLHDRIFELL
ncbi:MAG: hypothetical protein JNL70_23190 [Saprospiraceae bacterium]|nr:hypothetical protein [Saprospiraceae bacterium]